MKDHRLVAARFRAFAFCLIGLLPALSFAAVPGKPGGFVSASDGTNAEFAWTAPGSGDPATSYRIYRKAPVDDPATTANEVTSWIYQGTVATPATNWTQTTGINPSYSYEYCVAAVNSSGQGPQSDSAIFALKRFDFVLPWDDVTTSATTDFGGLNVLLNSSRAIDNTKRIFRHPTDGTFRVGSAAGPVIRFVGVNMSAGACFPTSADAVTVAKRMAQFGINLVRFHQIDQQKPKGVFADANLTALDTTTNGQMAKLAYFISQLKLNGIYVDMNLCVLRTYANADGSDRKRFKGVDVFSKTTPSSGAGMRQQQKDYARELLTYANGSGLGTYATDPVVAFIEINNEDGLLANWSEGDLNALTSSYQSELKAQWNAWLTTSAINATPYADASELSAAWSAAPATTYNSTNLLPATLPSSGSLASPWQAQIVTSGSAEGSMSWVDEDAAGVESPSGNALKIDVAAADTTNKWHVQALYNYLALSGTDEHTLTFHGKTAAGAGSRNMRVLLRKKSNSGDVNYTTVGIAPFTLTESWQKLTVAFPATGSYAAGTVSLVFTDFAAQTGVAYLSGFSLTAGNTFKGSAAATAETAGAGLLAGESWNNVDPIATGGFAGRYRRVQTDWLRFLWETEVAYWKEMKTYLKTSSPGGLGAQALIIGTQVQYSPCQLQAEAGMDVMDSHAYWGHPSSFASGWTMTNRSMAGMDALSSSTLANCSNRRVIGMPYLVSEYNHPAPGTYGTEGFPLIAAYGAMQGWSGFCAFDYEDALDASNNIRWSAGSEGWLAMGRAPAKMVTLPAARVMQRPQGVSTAYNGAAAGVALAAVRKTTFIEEIRQKVTAGSTKPATLSAGHFGVPAECVYTMPIGLKYDTPAATNCDYLAIPSTTPGAPYSPAGGELTWRTTSNNKRVEIRTRMSKAVLGELPTSGSTDLGDGVTVTSSADKLQGSANNWACFVLTRKDAYNTLNFGAAGTRWLLTTTGYSDNYMMAWIPDYGPTDSTSSVSSFGRTPTLIETITGSLTFTVPANAFLHAYALNENGDAFGDELQIADPQPGGGASRTVTVTLPENPLTLWYEMYVNTTP